MTCAGGSSRNQTGHRGRTGDLLYGLRRVLRRRHDRLSPHAWRHLETGLAAGDPAGEVALAWDVAQKVMTLYPLADPTEQADRAQRLVAALRTCPIPELARLGRTLHAWRLELLAAFRHPDVGNGPTENLNLKIKNTKRTATATATSPATDYDCCSTTAAATRITHRRAPEPAVPTWLHRA